MKRSLSCLVLTFSFRLFIGMSKQRRILIHSWLRKQRWSRTDTNQEEKSNDIDEPFVEQKAKAEHSDSRKKPEVVWKWGLIALAANLNN